MEKTLLTISKANKQANKTKKHKLFIIYSVPMKVMNTQQGFCSWGPRLLMVPVVCVQGWLPGI